MNYLKIAELAAKAAVSRKAKRPVLLDLNGSSDICDYQLICSGDNEKQTRAIAESIEDSLRVGASVKPGITEGKINGHWILMDYGALNIHIFYDYLRDYYALEQLWSKASHVELDLGAK